MSHGSKNHRRPASSGAKGPARTFKGKHSPGQMGGNRVTVQNLEIVRVDVERNLLLVKGGVGFLPPPETSLLVLAFWVPCLRLARYSTTAWCIRPALTQRFAGFRWRAG